MSTAVGCSFCGCGAWNRNPDATACQHVGEQRTAPRATSRWVCIVCPQQSDEWSATIKHYFQTTHGFVSTWQRTLDPDHPYQEIPSMKRFKKIRYNERSVALEYTVHDGTKTEDIQAGCEDAPHADFNAALQALRQDVLVICELDDSYGEGMRVQSVSLSFNAKTGARGAVVTAMKALPIANSPLALHTPHLLAEGKAKDDEKNTGKAEPEESEGVMPAGMWKRIEALEAEAWAYLDGKTGPKVQLGLSLGGTKEKEPELAGAGV